MTRSLAVLILLLALAGLTGCLVYGGGYYQPQYVCWDVFIGYDYYGRAVYQTVCEWQDIAPQDVGEQEIAGVYASEGNVLTRQSGAALAVNQLIGITDGDANKVIRVLGVSEPAASTL